MSHHLHLHPQLTSSSNPSSSSNQRQLQSANSPHTITLNPITQYTSTHLSSSLLSLLKSQGFNKTSSRAHSHLNELFVRYLQLVAKDAQYNATHSNRTEATVKDVEAALENLGTGSEDLMRWCRNTREGDAPLEENLRNLLKDRASDLRRECLGACRGSDIEGKLSFNC